MTGRGVEHDEWHEWRAAGWLPRSAPAPAPEDLITRDQLLAKLERLGLKVNPRTLRHWEHEGVLPAPIRRRHRGATRALYPPWMVNLVWQLLAYRDEGFALAELPERMRHQARGLAVQRVLAGVPPDSPFWSFLIEHYPRVIGPYAAAFGDIPTADPTGYPFEPLSLPPELARELEALAGRLTEVAGWWGFPATGASLTLTDRHDRALTIPIRLPGGPDPGPRSGDPPAGE